MKNEAKILELLHLLAFAGQEAALDVPGIRALASEARELIGAAKQSRAVRLSREAKMDVLEDALDLLAELAAGLKTLDDPMLDRTVIATLEGDMGMLLTNELNAYQEEAAKIPTWWRRPIDPTEREEEPEGGFGWA